MIQKRTGERKTMQFSQLDRDQASIEPTFFRRVLPGQEDFTEDRWNELKSRAINYLERMLDDLKAEKGEGGAHWQSRVRNMKNAIEVVQRQMAFPWTWRDFSEVLAGNSPLGTTWLKRKVGLYSRLSTWQQMRNVLLWENPHAIESQPVQGDSSRTP